MLERGRRHDAARHRHAGDATTPTPSASPRPCRPRSRRAASSSRSRRSSTRRCSTCRPRATSRRCSSAGRAASTRTATSPTSSPRAAATTTPATATPRWTSCWATPRASTDVDERADLYGQVVEKVQRGRPDHLPLPRAQPHRRSRTTSPGVSSLRRRRGPARATPRSSRRGDRHDPVPADPPVAVRRHARARLGRRLRRRARSCRATRPSPWRARRRRRRRSPRSAPSSASTTRSSCSTGASWNVPPRRPRRVDPHRHAGHRADRRRRCRSPSGSRSTPSSWRSSSAWRSARSPSATAAAGPSGWPTRRAGRPVACRTSGSGILAILWLAVGARPVPRLRATCPSATTRGRRSCT